MKLYLITAKTTGAQPETNDEAARWVSSQADAASARKELAGIGFKRADIKTTEVDVPTKKDELVGFLNLLVSGPTMVAAVEKLTAK